jgi:hypothetical protein
MTIYLIIAKLQNHERTILVTYAFMQSVLKNHMYYYFSIDTIFLNFEMLYQSMYMRIQLGGW